MRRLAGVAFLAVAFLAMLPASVSAQPCRLPACSQTFPADAGAINVRDYGAKGDGRTDDTTALLKAIAASGGDTGFRIWEDRIVFFPAGTYLVSDTLVKRYGDGRFASGMILMGESVDRTTIRLIDHAKGFDDPSAPRGVVMTTSKRIDNAGNRDYAHLGEGNDAYENFVENLTVDVGVDNPGAVGIDYLGNNIGAIRNVLVRAPASSGATGIAATRKFPGPALIQNVAIEGFTTGIDVTQSEYGMTLSRVSLKDQRGTGVRNFGNVLAADDLVVENAGGVPIVNGLPTGLLVLAGGTADRRSFDANQGAMVFRNVRFAPDDRPQRVPPDGQTDGWLFGHEWHGQVPVRNAKLEDAPIVDGGPVKQWLGVTGVPYGAPPEDVTSRLQQAFDLGASTIYLKHGVFWISATIAVPPTLRRIVGMNSAIRVIPEKQSDTIRKQGELRVNQAGPPLLIEKMAMDNSDQGDQVGIVVDASRTIILRDVIGNGVTVLDRQKAGGDAFLDDTCCGGFRFAGPKRVLARQLDTEGPGVRVFNQGSPLTIIGLKTEGNCTAVRTTQGGSTDILGGFIYVVGTSLPENTLPAFIADDGHFSASFVEESFRPDSRYGVYLSDNQGGRKREFVPGQMPGRGYGRLVPMLENGPGSQAK